jgi:hypothetical protein
MLILCGFPVPAVQRNAAPIETIYVGRRDLFIVPISTGRIRRNVFRLSEGNCRPIFRRFVAWPTMIDNKIKGGKHPLGPLLALDFYHLTQCTMQGPPRRQRHRG